MKQKSSALIFQSSAFKWIAVATAAILLMPLIAMQITTEIAWGSTDFIVMGSLIVGLSSLFVLVARKLPIKQGLLAGAMFVAVFLYIWAELAVGLFTNLGS